MKSTILNYKDIIIIVSGDVKKHIMTHNKIGIGSVFKKGVSDSKIVELVKTVGRKVSGDGGAYQLKISGIGYDLVLPMNKANKLKDAEDGYVLKDEGPSKVKVPSVTTSQPLSDFSTNIVTFIIRKSNPQYLPSDVKNNENVNSKIKEGNCYSVLTAFPGNPDIPKASQWNNNYAVIIPK